MSGRMRIKGEIKTTCEDFEVEEIPAYEPCGEGEHIYLWIEKRDASAKFALRQVARALGVQERDIGSAGNKDRRAVTRQYMSVPAHAVTEHLEWLLDAEGHALSDQVTILSAKRHTNKLRRGHLKGNRFRVRVRDVDMAGLPQGSESLEQEVARRVSALERSWLPNFYGAQRFGRGEETVELGLGLLRQERHAKKRVGRDRFLKRLALNAVQSKLFNAVLAKRLEHLDEGGHLEVFEGDVMELTERGGLFVCEEVEQEQRRLASREIMITGPMQGPKMFAPTSQAAAFEGRVLGETLDIDAQAFHAYSKLCSGSRRALKVRVVELAASVYSEAEIDFRFSLPSGSYATVVLAHLLDDVLTHDASRRV